MPCSPFLSIMILKEFLEQTDHVNYADDQIHFSHTPFEIKDNPDYGIILAKEKCGGLKYEGKWTEKGIKFLGLRLFKDGKFQSETRKGTIGQMNEVIKKLYTKSDNIEEAIQVAKSISDVDALTRFVLTDGIVDLDGTIRALKKTDPCPNLRSQSKNMVGSIYASLEKNEGSLVKLARKNIFGFIMSCMILDDGKNDHGYHDNLKAIRNMLGKLHPKSIFKRIPKNTDSSGAISYLATVVKQSMRNPKELRHHKGALKEYTNGILINNTPTDILISDLKKRFRKKRKHEYPKGAKLKIEKSLTES